MANEIGYGQIAAALARAQQERAQKGNIWTATGGKLAQMDFSSPYNSSATAGIGGFLTGLTSSLASNYGQSQINAQNEAEAQAVNQALQQKDGLQALSQSETVPKEVRQMALLKAIEQQQTAEAIAAQQAFELQKQDRTMALKHAYNLDLENVRGANRIAAAKARGAGRAQAENVASSDPSASSSLYGAPPTKLTDAHRKLIGEAQQASTAAKDLVMKAQDIKGKLKGGDNSFLGGGLWGRAERNVINPVKAAFGNEEAQAENEALVFINQFQTKIVPTIRKGFTGPLSDKDVEMLSTSVISPELGERTFQDVLDRAVMAANATKEYNDFIVRASDLVQNPDRMWSEYLDAKAAATDNPSNPKNALRVFNVSANEALSILKIKNPYDSVIPKAAATLQSNVQAPVAGQIDLSNMSDQELLDIINEER